MKGPVTAALEAEMIRIESLEHARLTDLGKALAAILAGQVVLAQALDVLGRELNSNWDEVKIG